MRWTPGRSYVAFWKRLQTLQAGDCCCDDGEIVNTLRNGEGVPDPALGIDGDFYIDTDADTIYGPKGGIGGVTPGIWGSPTSLVGPPGVPSGPDKSVQYKNGASLAGAAHASISEDGNLCIGSAPASVGAIRLSNGSSVVYRSEDGTADIGLLNTDSFNAISVGDGASAGDLNLKSHTAVILSAHNAVSSLDVNGVQFRSDGIAPTVSPVAGASIWIDPSTHHPMARMPDGTVFDLTATGGGETSIDVAADPAGADLVIDQTVGTIEIATSGDVTLVGMTAPAAGVSQRVIIANWNDDSAAVSIGHDSGVIETNGFRFPDSSTFHMSGLNAEFYYDHRVSRWCPVSLWVTGT